MNIAFFDVDQTILEGFSGSDICAHFEREGIFPPGFAEWDAAMVEQYKKGEVSYHDLAKQVIERLTLYFKGRAIGEVSDLMARYSSLVTNKIFPWVYPVLDFLRAKNFKIALVSASSEPFIQTVAKQINADHMIASTPEIRNNEYTGVLLRFLNGNEKLAAIEELIKSEKPERTIAFGDSTGDVPMLERVDCAFLHEPSQQELVERARTSKNWFIADRYTMEETVKKILFP